MTKRLYREFPEDSTFWGRIVSLTRDEANEERVSVELEQSLFYPASGGQPCDLGTLNTIAVVNVIEDGETIIHELAPDPTTKKWAKGRELEGAIDLARRRVHMEQHSGQHLLSATLLSKLEIETVSFHLGAELSTIDIAAETLSPEQIAEVEAEANVAIRACLPVKVTVHRGSAVTPIMERLRKAPAPELLESPHGLRIVQIGPDEAPIDRDPCCGTHVTNTGELGSIVILGTERGRKGEVRVTFAVGRRATAAIRARLDALQNTGTVLTSGFLELPQRGEKLLAQVKELKRDQRRSRERLITFEAEAFALGQEGDILARLLDEGEPKDAGTYARACLKARPKARVVVVHQGEMATAVVACGNGADVSAGAVLKDVLATFEGKGGGGPTFAQGAAPDPAKAEPLLAALRAKLEASVGTATDSKSKSESESEPRAPKSARPEPESKTEPESDSDAEAHASPAVTESEDASN